MANGWPTPLTVPEPAGFVIGEPLKAEKVLPIGEALNYLHASMVRGYPGQHWPDGACAYDASPAVDVCEWAVPLPSPAHQTLRVEIYASASANAGIVRFTSANTGAVLALNVNAGAGIYAGTLNVGAPAGGYDEITMSLEATSGDVQVDSRMFWAVALTSPLAAGVVTTVGSRTITPFGQLALSADEPLPASRARMMIETGEALVERVRVLWCWSGLSNVQTFRAGAKAIMTDYHRRQFALVHPGAEAKGVTYTVRVKTAANGGVVDQYVYMQIGRLDAAPILVATQAVGAAAAWHTAKITLPEQYPIAGLPYAAAWIVVHPDGPGRTTADITSISIWGE